MDGLLCDGPDARQGTWPITGRSPLQHGEYVLTTLSSIQFLTLNHLSLGVAWFDLGHSRRCWLLTCRLNDVWETVTLSRAKPWITLGQWFTGLDVSPKANLCWAHSSLSIAGQSATAYDVGCSLSAHTSRGWRKAVVICLVHGNVEAWHVSC